MQSQASVLLLKMLRKLHFLCQFITVENNIISLLVAVTEPPDGDELNMQFLTIRFSELVFHDCLFSLNCKGSGWVYSNYSTQV